MHNEEAEVNIEVFFLFDALRLVYSYLRSESA